MVANERQDLFAKWYVRDGDEYEREELEIEPEGYLHGKKINDAKEDSASEGEAPMSACPFASMAAGMGKLNVDDKPDVVPHLPASHASYMAGK